MKSGLLSAVAAIALIASCTETPKTMGAANENDRNVLTGGPVTGTHIADLPDPVRQRLKESVPNGEVADIDKQLMDGKTVYKISFAEPGKNPSIYIAEDGTVVQKKSSSK